MLELPFHGFVVVDELEEPFRMLLSDMSDYKFSEHLFPTFLTLNRHLRAIDLMLGKFANLDALLTKLTHFFLVVDHSNNDL